MAAMASTKPSVPSLVVHDRALTQTVVTLSTRNKKKMPDKPKNSFFQSRPSKKHIWKINFFQKKNSIKLLKFFSLSKILLYLCIFEMPKFLVKIRNFLARLPLIRSGSNLAEIMLQHQGTFPPSFSPFGKNFMIKFWKIFHAYTNDLTVGVSLFY